MDMTMFLIELLHYIFIGKQIYWKTYIVLSHNMSNW